MSLTEKCMNDLEIMNIKPKPTKGTMMRVEAFGAMLAGGNRPILSLNEDAKEIWEMCNGSRTVAEIEQFFLKEYEAEKLHEKLIEFIKFGLSNGLLEDANRK